LAPNEAAIAAAMPKARVVFKELARLLGEQAYFAGKAVSPADFLIAPQMDMFAHAPEWDALTGDHPNLCAWLQRMNARPSFKATTWERVTEMARAA
jgi:glutathione S-transferase